MRNKYVLLFLFLFLLVAFNVNAAHIVSTDGLPDSSGVHPLYVDSDGIVYFKKGVNVSTEAATTSDTITAAESGKVISVACTSACEFELPAAVVGMNYPFASTDNSATFAIDPNGTDTIKYAPSNVPLDAGDKMTSPGATGDSVEVVCATAGIWTVKSRIGTFTDGGQ